MPYRYTKNGVNYVMAPIDTLNTLPKGKKRGDLLQEFFNANGIDIDLQSGTGKDCDTLCYVSTDKYRHADGFGKVFYKTDYSEKNYMLFADNNQNASENLRDALHPGLFSSNLYIFRGGERSPRKLYIDDGGQIAMSAPLAQLNPADMIPEKPNSFKTFLHWLNKNWFKSDFDEYDRQVDSHKHFSDELNNVKREIAAYEAKEKLDKLDAPILKNPDELKALEEKFRSRVMGIYGKNPKLDQKLIDRRVINEGEYIPEKVEYPKDCPFNDWEMAMLGYAAICSPDVAQHAVRSKYIKREEAVPRTFVHLTDDILYNEREKSGSTYCGAFNPARLKAVECVKEFMKGNTQPLAELLGQSVKFHLKVLQTTMEHSALSCATMHAAMQLMDFISRDPMLLAQCGLTAAEIAAFKGREVISESFEKMIEGRKKIQRAGRGEIKLSEREKTDAMLDILEGEVLTRLDVKARTDYETANSKVTGNFIAKELTPLMLEVADLKGELGASNNDPEKAKGIKEKLNDANERCEAANTRLEIFGLDRPSSDFLIGLGTDEHAVEKLRNDISNSKVFKEFSAKTVEQLAADQRKPENGAAVLTGAAINLIDELVKAKVKNQEVKKPEGPEEVKQVSRGMREEIEPEEAEPVKDRTTDVPSRK